MTNIDLIHNLIEFYEQCSNRGWCKVKREKGDFVTLYSSEYNFTHLSLIFGKLPKVCLVSPKLASKNIKTLKALLLEFDSQRLVSIAPFKFWYRVRIVDGFGNVIKDLRIRRYTVGWR